MTARECKVIEALFEEARVASWRAGATCGEDDSADYQITSSVSTKMFLIALRSLVEEEPNE